MQATVVADGGLGISDVPGHRSAWGRVLIRWGAPAVSVALASVAMVVGAVDKLSCVALPQMSCYSDVDSLWTARHLASHVLPYVHGGIQGSGFVGHELEYPVLTGLFVWLCSLPAHSLVVFMLVTVLALAPFGALTAWLLARMAGRRALFFSGAPTLIWYAFLNWDLLGVASAVTAVYAWSRGRYRLAGLALGVGACFKLWPGYLLLPLAADLLCRRRGREAVEAVGAAVAAAVVTNIPFMIASFPGWRAPFTFQTLRPADLSANSLWPALDPALKAARAVGTVNHLAAAACAVAFAAILGAGVRRYRREGDFPFVQASAAMVAVFVALGKVHSPQYALWILPFFALLRIRWGWWGLFLASDVWLYFQYTAFGVVHASTQRSAVIVADAVLVILAVVFMRSEPAAGVLGPGLADLPG